MGTPRPPGRVPLPPDWPAVTARALLAAVALAHMALVRARSWCADSRLARVRLRAEVDRLNAEVALLREEIRIKDERMGMIHAAKRPHYPPHERLAILAVRAARGWSVTRTARAFLVTPPTVASWMRRLHDDGPEALVRLPAPVNRMPEFVTVVVQQLRALCPLLGKVRIAQMLARAGLHLSASTVGRALRRPPAAPLPGPASAPPTGRDPVEPGARDGLVVPRRVVTARWPHDVWHVDLTVVPTRLGFWVPWLPQVLAQCWPFGAWVAIALDHFSRAVVARAVLGKQPSAADVCRLLDTAVAHVGVAPRYIVTDQGAQFQGEYRAWCAPRGVRPRFGAVGQHGSIAIVERFIRSMKQECFRTAGVPLTLTLVEQELDTWLAWYHAHRPHQGRGLAGRTPAEMLEHRDGAPRHQRAPPPPASIPPLHLVVKHVEGRAHLPIVELRRSA